MLSAAHSIESYGATPMTISSSALAKIDGRPDSHEMLLQFAFLTYELFSIKLLSRREKKSINGLSFLLKTLQEIRFKWWKS